MIDILLLVADSADEASYRPVPHGIGSVKALDTHTFARLASGAPARADWQ